jgi:Fe-S oxidoreductase
VVLFPDTFNNHLHTQVGVACVEALEHAGWQVVMPPGKLCCGRPLYDFGLLDSAERYLHRVLEELRPHIRTGTPVVGMEPSCLAVLKDELTKILPYDDDAERLRRTAYHFGEFFEKFELEVPRYEGKALLWGHCHHRATGGVDTEQRVLERMGADVDAVTGGCCGLAGSWGFEKGKHGMSLECGDQALLPAVRRAASSTVVVANGFSCQTQIEQAGTGRHALHLAEVMALARDGTPARAGSPEEQLSSSRPRPPMARRAARTAGPLVAAAGAAAAAATALRRGARRRA